MYFSECGYFFIPELYIIFLIPSKHTKCNRSNTIPIVDSNFFVMQFKIMSILMAESEEELRSILTKVKEEGEKAGLKLSFKKLRSWHQVPSLHGKGGEKMETVTDFIFLDSKITVDDDCSHEIERCLLLGRKALTYLSQQSNVSAF